MVARTSAKCPLNERASSIVKMPYYVSENQGQATFKSGDQNLIKGICDCILDVLSGYVKVSEKCKKQWSKCSNYLRKLIKPLREKSWQRRKQILSCDFFHDFFHQTLIIWKIIKKIFTFVPLNRLCKVRDVSRLSVKSVTLRRI